MFVGAEFYLVLMDNSVGWLVTEFVDELSSLYLNACNLIVFESIQRTHSMNPFKREIKMVNNFKGNKGQIYILIPLTAASSI
jgi:hypothetical protein